MIYYDEIDIRDDAKITAFNKELEIFNVKDDI